MQISAFMDTEVKKFYDELWNSDQSIGEYSELLRIRESAIKYSYDAMGRLKNKNLLEVGCGAGLKSVAFAKRGAKVTAVDFSDKSIELTSRLAKKEGIATINALKMNAEKLNLKSNSFDLVYIDSVLMHVNVEKVISECLRVLKNGGKLVVVEPLNSNPFMLLYRFLFSDYKKTSPKYMSIKLLKKHSKLFSQTRIREFYFSSVMFLFLFRILNEHSAKKAYRIIERADDFFIRAFPFLRRFCWIAVAEYIK